MIRPAVISDLSRLEAMGARFFAASGMDRWFSYKPQDFSTTIANAIASDQGLALVGDGPIGAVGMAVAIAYPVYFNFSHSTAQELIWWVEPEYRGGQMGAQLRQGLEEWARGKGCLTMEMGALETLRPEALAHLYERRGYEPKERIFVKSLL
jgi:GNAT superfamily N-acetyltransferase